MSPLSGKRGREYLCVRLHRLNAVHCSAIKHRLPSEPSKSLFRNRALAESHGHLGPRPWKGNWSFSFHFVASFICCFIFKGRNLTFLFIFKHEEKYSSDFFFFSFRMLVLLTKALRNHLYHVGLTFPSEKGGIVLFPTHWPGCWERLVSSN